jgi:hypothetical protein
VPLERLAAALRAEGGLLSAAVADPEPGVPVPHGAAAAAGPRGARAPEDYAFLVEAIREGHLLHYGGARVLRTADDDLALLAGDRLYALGLEVLSGLGDLDAVACSRTHRGGGPRPRRRAPRGCGSRLAGRSGGRRGRRARIRAGLTERARRR